jgi:hypothetical protein
MVGLDPQMLMALQALGQMQGMPGLGAMPQMAQMASAPGGPLVAGPPTEAQAPMVDPSLGGAAKGPAPFPINAAVLAALGAGAGGLQAGRRPPAPMAGTPSVAARAPGGFSPVYNRLPGRG